MKRETIADIEFVAGSRLPTERIIFHAKMSGDDETGHPNGQWSLAIDPIVQLFESTSRLPMSAFVAFVSTEAPHESLKRGARFDLFRGTQRVGSLVVTQARAADDVCGLPLEADFLSGDDDEFLGAA